MKAEVKWRGQGTYSDIDTKHRNRCPGPDQGSEKALFVSARYLNKEYGEAATVRLGKRESL